jgi:hypothetical protein
MRYPNILAIALPLSSFVAASCSTAMNPHPEGPDAGLGAAGSGAGTDTSSYSGAPGGAGGYGGGGGYIAIDGGARGYAGGGAGGCWWHEPNAGGSEVGRWPASPTRTPGLAVARVRVDAWTVMSNTDAPSGPREGAAAVWTGREMIVWGGFGLRPEATGGRYDPASDKWSPISASLAPRGRQRHVAVWTGSEMIVWGGYDGTTILTSGGRYDPAADKWTAMSLDGAPTMIYDPKAVWTGTELIVWASATIATGGRYDPKTDTWKAIATKGAPVPQKGSSLVWTGKEMIVWGGYVNDACNYSADGAIYDPSTDTWRPMSAVGAPHPRYEHSAVWTGRQMIVWGGSNESPNAASYDPVADAWYALSEVEAPSPRQTPALFFLPDDGTPGAGRMLVWGGVASNGYDAATGGIYDFVPNQWGVVAPFPVALDSPNRSSYRTTVWTGTELLAWDVGAGVGARYRP